MVEHTCVHAYMPTVHTYTYPSIYPAILYYDFDVCWCEPLTSKAYPQLVAAPAVSKCWPTLLSL